jgi:transcriptional regulator of acetoin/glycerol metabolism
MRLLLDYGWPGNVRELANVIEYAVVVSRRETILPEDLPLEIRQLSDPASSSSNQIPGSNGGAATLPAAADPEVECLLEALEKHHWKRADAARELSLSRSTLWRRMRELHLE